MKKAHLLVGIFLIFEALNKQIKVNYSFSHNHGSGNWPYLKGKTAIGGTYFSLPCLWEEVFKKIIPLFLDLSF